MVMEARMRRIFNDTSFVSLGNATAENLDSLAIEGVAGQSNKLLL
jgi:hypothetical protein